MNEELRVAIDEQLRALHESYQLIEDEPIIGYYCTMFNESKSCYEISSSIFLSYFEAAKYPHSYIEEIEIDRTSLINYIKEHNLLD